MQAALDLFYEELEQKEMEFEADGEAFLKELQLHMVQCAQGLQDDQVQADIVQ